eukprot:TRINITY_DN524_c1_g1_i1.p1 TRINITY_DN524_c1_g1~~TRINITY_DN524_c1_g1_i1.p1  ORF type:complete len:534 (+),score=191.84 TRINITY_DN524_c1_g1_i1:195-1796(+)
MEFDREDSRSRGDSDEGEEIDLPSDVRGQAARIFRCSYKQCTPFRDKADPFNPGNKLCGYISRKDGSMGGSLYVTHVNDERLDQPTVIYGTPKLVYPYTDFDSLAYQDFSDIGCCSFVLANKWNGTNVLIFKYRDRAGNLYLSAKSKGSVFLVNGPFGQFATLTLRALQLDGDVMSASGPPGQLEPLLLPSMQSMTFELCGQLERHLVQYDFEVALKPLFVTYADGSIAPARNSDDLGPLPFNNDQVRRMCREVQAADLARNEAHRAASGLPHRYEHDHFIVEGRVLYLLDAAGRLIKRTMHKIKPTDIEEVHWASFDSTIQGRVREAVEKVVLREKKLNEKSLREELDMGPKEWGRFGREIVKYVDELRTGQLPSKIHDHRRLLVLSGYPGSGVREFAAALTAADGSWIVADGSAHDCRGLLEKHLADQSAKMVAIRYNVTRRHREAWVEEALKWGVLSIDCVYFEMPVGDAKRFVRQRRETGDAPKMPGEDEALKCTATRPLVREGFNEITVVKSPAELQTALALFVSETR